VTAKHEHTWVNTPSGVLCTGCKEKIEAPECAHEYRFDRIEETGQSMRKAILVCKLCDREQAVLTNRTDEEIRAEIEKADA
jgi:hypothetical protein